MEVVLDMVAYGWSAEEIHRQHPHLPLSKIHAALAYYYDHQAEMDAEIARDNKEFEMMYQAAAREGNAPSMEELRQCLQAKLSAH